ncbi:cyclic nucleotide-binding domain protein (macronuclear) [Tetrahymena thermophila SB210]|uniref:Cyclic nucleotide-binding domain protein n=1 Tax=Tetrahymena thermophila (strain SB210) TaxID=312017 RepID=Q241C3_TETTS|nr:cyclic nucleotide-binding domain protein [Tetrahymena thermophila SB210]EAS02385.2 cyclic nucleotide-binding domain protein [Tetrahymena thermophila SB210]|eukprot:XP_001022630.2 cyclic nucleotide-binding domain protein [Tetrahymena thermophila SB210]
MSSPLPKQRAKSTTKSTLHSQNKTTLSTFDTQQDDFKLNESHLRNILYDFNSSTTTQEKLCQMKNCLNELPLEMIRDVAFLPQEDDSNIKEPNTSKEILYTTKGFTNKMKISFMKIKSSLNPNINATTLQNFFIKTQQENDRIKQNYSHITVAKEIQDSPQIQRSLTPKANQTFLTPQNKKINIKFIKTQNQKSNPFKLQLTENINGTNRRIHTTQNDCKIRQAQSILEIVSDHDKILDKTNQEKQMNSNTNIFDTPQNSYDNSKSTQDKSTSRNVSANLNKKYYDIEDSIQKFEVANQFYDIPVNLKSTKKKCLIPNNYNNSSMIYNNQDQSLLTSKARTVRSVSNQAGRDRSFIQNDHINNSFSNALNSNNSNNNFYQTNKLPSFYKNKEASPQYKTKPNQIDFEESYLKSKQKTPIKSIKLSSSPYKNTEQQSEEEISFFQKKVRRNALIDLRKLNPNIQKMTQYSKDFLPPWLRARPDFLKLYLQDQINKNLKLPTIFVKDYSLRTMAEKQETHKYLSSIPQFSQLESDLVDLISKKIKVEIYYPGDFIQEINEVCQNIIILYDGQVSRIFKDQKEEQLEKNIALNTTFLRKQFFNQFGLKSENNCIIFTLNAEDLQEIDSEFASSISNDFQIMLTLHDFFHKYEPKTLKQMSIQAKGKLLFPGENLFKIGDPSNEIYFIYFGKIEKKKVFYTQEKNRWPIKKNNNLKDSLENGEDYHLQENNYGYRVFTKNFTNSKFLGKTDFFGDQETIYEVGRRTEASAVEPTFLLWLDRQTFLNILSLDDLNQLYKFRAQKPIKLTPEQSPEYYFKLEKKNKYQKERILNALDVVFKCENNLSQLERLEKKIEPFKKQILTKYNVKNKFNTTCYK